MHKWRRPGARVRARVAVQAAPLVLLCTWAPALAAPLPEAGDAVGRTELLVPAVRGSVGDITRELVN